MSASPAPLTMFGRIVCPTTLNPIPRAFRTAPGCLALHVDEIAALKANDGETFKRIAAIVTHEDAMEMEATFGKKRRRKRR